MYQHEGTQQLVVLPLVALNHPKVPTKKQAPMSLAQLLAVIQNLDRLLHILMPGEVAKSCCPVSGSPQSQALCKEDPLSPLKQPQQGYP